MRIVAALAVLGAMLVIAGCGATHHRAVPQTGAALAAAIRTENPNGRAPGTWHVRCHGHACTIAWNDGLDATNGWAVVLPTVASLVWDVHAVRHLVIKIRDPHSRRSATFICDMRKAARPNQPPSTEPHAAHNLPGCLEFDRRLT